MDHLRLLTFKVGISLLCSGLPLLFSISIYLPFSLPSCIRVTKVNPRMALASCSCTSYF